MLNNRILDTKFCVLMSWNEANATWELIDIDAADETHEAGWDKNGDYHALVQVPSQTHYRPNQGYRSVMLKIISWFKDRQCLISNKKK